MRQRCSLRRIAVFLKHCHIGASQYVPWFPLCFPMFGLVGLQDAAAVTLASWFVLDACTGYLARVTPKEDGSEEPEPASSIQFSGSCHTKVANQSQKSEGFKKLQIPSQLPRTIGKPNVSCC